MSIEKMSVEELQTLVKNLLARYQAEAREAQFLRYKLDKVIEQRNTAIGELEKIGLSGYTRVVLENRAADEYATKEMKWNDTISALQLKCGDEP